MAILYPPIEVINRMKVPPTQGEKTLLTLLETLDDRFEIYFQPYLNGDRPDVILINKEAGILIFEVKDWNLNHYYLNNRCDWVLKKNDAIVKSPFTQINNYRKNMINLHIEGMLEHLLKDTRYYSLVNSCVVFANATNQEIFSRIKETKQKKPKSSYLNYLQYLGSDGLAKSNELKNMIEKCRLHRKSLILKSEFISSLHRNLKPPIHELEDGIQIAYNKAQTELSISNSNDRRKIKGVAGSGKTMVLAKRAVNAFKRTGKPVLILTYNLSLRNYIRDRISDVREKFEWNNFHIYNYHTFFKVESNNYSIPINTFADWDDEHHFKPAAKNIYKYKTILIDEVQDFKQEWLRLLINYFLIDEGELVVFGDEKQNIYERKMDEDKTPVIPTIRGAWNRSLNQVYRFSGDLITLTKAFQNEILSQKYNIDEVEELQQEIQFDKTEIEYNQVDHIDSKLVTNIIKDTLNKNQISSSDACVLSTDIETLRDIDHQFRQDVGERTTTTFETKEFYEELLNKKERLFKKNNANLQPQIAQKSINENDISSDLESIRRSKKYHFEMRTGFMKISTIHSFKGWDIPYLFLIIDAQTDLEKAELIYTGITRARYRLFIINIVNNSYHKCFSNSIKNNIQHFFLDEKIDKIKNDFNIKGKNNYRVGDKFKMISSIDGEKKEYSITKLKKYKVLIEDGYKFKFIIRQCGEINSSHRLRTGTKFLEEFRKKENMDEWITYYEKVMAIKYFDFINDYGGFYKLIDMNGILINSNNDCHFVCSVKPEILEKTGIKKGFQLVSINGTDLKDKNQIDLLNILNVQKGKVTSAILLDIDGSYIEFKVSELKFGKKGIGLIIPDKNNPKTASIMYLAEDKKIDISPVIYLRSSDGQENINLTSPRFEYEIERA